MTKPDARTVNLVHYPAGDATDPQELGAYLDAIEADIAAISTNLASTANGDGASLIGIEDSGGLITATTVEGALAENRTAIDAVESGKAGTSQTMVMSFLIEVADNKDYIFILNSPIAFSILGITSICSSGSCTLTGYINTTALGGTANSVTTSQQTQVHASANSVSTTDTFKVTISSNSAAENVAVMVHCTRVLAT